MLETAAEIASRIALYQTTAFAPRIFIPLLLENYDDRGITPPPRRSEFYRKSELQGTEALFYSTPTTHRLSASAGVCLLSLLLYGIPSRRLDLHSTRERAPPQHFW